MRARSKHEIMISWYVDLEAVKADNFLNPTKGRRGGIAARPARFAARSLACVPGRGFLWASGH